MELYYYTLLVQVAVLPLFILAALYTKGWWRAQMVVVAILIEIISAAIVLVISPSLWAALFGLVSLYEVVNFGRILRGRMNQAYLYTSVLSAMSWLALGRAIAAMLWLLDIKGLWRADMTILYTLISAIAATVALVMFASALYRYKSSRIKLTAQPLGENKLPTVSVLVPARNETEQLAVMLDSMLASDYQKLEVIVLDDCSQDKTADVVRSYAHSGVRFIEGTPPIDESWLHKNHACQALLNEAAGEIVIFCGVDVRFSPQSLRRLVEQFISDDYDMACVLPRHADSRLADLLIQPMRHWWQLALPKELFGRAPVLSTCWIARRQTIVELGGFAAARRSIEPESYFARQLLKRRAYGFYYALNTLEITSYKGLKEQYQTAIRTLYPQVRHRIERVLLLSIFEVVCFILPFAMLGWSIIGGVNAAFLFNLIAVVGLSLAHACVIFAVKPVGFVPALVNFPIVSAMDIILRNLSMLRYEYSTVRWKGRDVCAPIMHATASSLPPIELSPSPGLVSTETSSMPRSVSVELSPTFIAGFSSPAAESSQVINTNGQRQAHRKHHRHHHKHKHNHSHH